MKILWIAFVWPEPCSSAAGLRTLQLIELCRSAGHEVRISSPCQDNSYRGDLERSGVGTNIFPPNDAAFDAFLRDYNPDAVFFDRFIIEEQFGWRVREQCPEALRILDTIDLHSVRRIRQAKVERGEDPLLLTDQDLNSDDALRELAAIYRSDLALIISSVEVALLRDRYAMPDELISLCGLFYPQAQSGLKFEERNNFVVIGNFNHPPNADSVTLLHDKLWPEIRLAFQRREVEPPELHIYGAYPSVSFLSLDNPSSGFRIMGRAEDAQATLGRYRINLAPLRFGSGLKGKIADGWRVGTPCVATSIAAEGMHDGIPFGGIVEDDWDLFANRAAELYLDPASWAAEQNNSLHAMESNFSKSSHAAAFLSAINTAVTQRQSRRERNFIGAMLWYSGNRSTEYFSRWIEEKNRRKPVS